jgi:hypothetical protein
MVDEQPSAAADLISGIIRGKVPRQVRLFAAQGLLPVSREELLSLQAILTADPDSELAEVAAKSLKDEDEETILAWLRVSPPDPLVLDLLVRVRDSEAVWSAVAANPNVSNETLRVLARNATSIVQDIIITNQVRLLSCLEILDDLRANPEVNQVVLRRVREFEEEFIQKVLAEEEEARLDSGRSIEEAIDSLRAIGAHIPNEDTLPYPLSDDPALADAIDRSGQGSAHAQLLKMSVHQRMIRALRGTREERAILINSRNRLVQRSVLSSPKLSDVEVERFASSRSVAAEVIKGIADNRRWLRLYPVVVALALNPKTPVYTATRIIPQLSPRDKIKVSRDRNINPVTRQLAQRLINTRRR